MANLRIPEAERSLSPSQVTAVDTRRRWGLAFLVISGQFGFFAVLLLLWSGQDLTYSPGWVHPMFYYNVAAALLACVFGAYGMYLRRGRFEYQ
jgi:nitrate reductase gamma subunit